MKMAMLLAAFAAAHAQGWDVSGTVTYEGKPGKDVWVRADGPSTPQPVKCDSQGRYALKGEGAGVFTITALGGSDTVQTVARTVSLAPGGNRKLDLAIPKGAVISGRVLDRDKHPVPGVEVTALTKSAGPMGLQIQASDDTGTNDQGEYRIAHLPPGQYIIAMSPRPPKLRRNDIKTAPPADKDYPPETYYPGTSLVDDAIALNLKAGEEQSGLDIVVEKKPSHCISFQVGGAYTSSTDEKSPFSSMHLERGRGTGSSLFDEDPRPGEFSRVCGLTAGDYRLSLQTLAPGRYLKVLGYLGIPFTMKDENLDLGTLAMPPSEELRGTVKLADGPSDTTIPKGIRVFLVSTENFSAQHDDSGVATVAADGSFAAPRVFPGDYGVRVSGLPAGYYVIDAVQQGRSVRYGGLHAGGGELRVTLGMDGATVTGRVLAEDGSAIPDASVILAPKGDRRPLVALSDQDGVYRFLSGIAPGEYRIAAVTDLAEGQRQDSGALAHLAAEGVDLSLAPKETKSLDLKAR